MVSKIPSLQTLLEERRRKMAPTINQEDSPPPETVPVEVNTNKKRKVEGVVIGFPKPIQPKIRPIASYKNKNDDVPSSSRALVMNVRRSPHNVTVKQQKVAPISCSKQFWKAGDYEGCDNGDKFFGEDMDHLRVHPKFLHSNATSHKWVLGAIAELLDNALDETSNGATYVHVDVLDNMKDKSKMVMVQDNGGGMTPAKMRQCMSLGYSAKSKMADTIGQYGNGFKTGTMRLGADVIVFSLCKGKNKESSTRSVGLLSYTFLRATRKEEIVVPMIDFEKTKTGWSMYSKSNAYSWRRNLKTILQWSPYESEEDLLHQFNFLSKQGTRIIIYNLWEDEEGSLELDFDSDRHDIQIRGEGKDPKKIEEARKHPSCSHFLTYRHSLRSYAAILYREIPSSFRIIIRRKVVNHYDIADDLIHTDMREYKPTGAKCATNVMLGFVKAELQEHVDIQGFNVYHKNRLIKPFWRVCNAAGSTGRGVVGVLEANFIKPAHDKQGFELTSLFCRLEKRLSSFQKDYWTAKSYLIGYAPSRGLAKNFVSSKNRASTSSPVTGKKHHRGSPLCNISGNKSSPPPCQLDRSLDVAIANMTPDGDASTSRAELESKMGGGKHSSPLCVVPQSDRPLDEDVVNTTTNGDASTSFSSIVDMVEKLKQENRSLSESLSMALQDLEDERIINKSLKDQLVEMKKKMDKMDKNKKY